MIDVVPDLLSDIETRFQTYTMTDKRMRSIARRIRDGTATQVDGHAYAERIGKNASKALQECLVEDRLPDGTLYYNIATRTVVPVLENNQALVNQAATEIQKSIDAKQGIGLNPYQPAFPSSRIKGLIDKMTADGITLDEALVWIKEPIVNNTEAFFDDFIQQNADVRTKAGMKAKISRIAESKCCEWCAALEGTWDYGDAPDDIYRRHEFCRCAVTVQYERTTQNVWSKKKWESTAEELARRKDTKAETMSAKERESMLERLEKDRIVKQIMDATGYDRTTANKIADYPPEKRAKAIERGRKYAYLRR